MDDLLQDFIAETRETMEALAGEIVAWEANPTDRSRLDAIFRFVHTVKGSCGFLDLPRLGRLAHSAEDVLAAVRDGQRDPDLALVNAVLAIVDRIGEVVEAIEGGAALDDSADDLLIAALAEDAAPVSQATSHGPARVASRSVRLSVDLLDRMMSGMSDLVLARNELARRMRDGGADPATEASLERLSLTLADMRDTVTRTRMQKIEALFSALPRLVRDTAAELGRQVQLSIEGSDVELDREMIELMRDPLVHIIRNAVDHGIEDADRRVALNKPAAGRLQVSARQSGNQIVIEVSDDGQGIDVGRLVVKAAQNRLKTEAELATMSEAERLELIFEAGLSSRDTVTATSGRGVGMDVVRANIEQIGGRVSLANRPGVGLTIAIHVPLTLSIISTIVVGAGAQRFAVARQSIEEIVRSGGAGIRIDSVGASRVVTVRDRRLPLVSLGELLGLSHADPAVLAIVSTRDGDYALGLDAVLDTEELVVKPAAPAVMATGVYAGQTLPDSGQPMLLLDGSGIAAVAGLRFGATSAATDEAVAAEDEGFSALLFDDLDGQRRAIALGAIDRVEQVPGAAVRMTGGRWRLACGETLVPIHASASLEGSADLTVLRLTDGTTELAYAVVDPIEIVTITGTLAAPDTPGLVAGVAMLGGEPVELIDALALFASASAPEPRTLERPICLLQTETGGWMDTFLRPAIEAAGYRCVTRLAGDERATLALTLDDVDGQTHAGTPVLRLRRDVHAARAGDGSIYRYDRGALLAALDGHRVGAIR